MIQISMVLAGLATAFVLLAEHWFPWRALLGHELPRAAAYILGTATLFGGITGWTIITEPAGDAILVGDWVIVVTGGVFVLAAYAIDAWALSRANYLELERRRENERHGGH